MKIEALISIIGLSTSILGILFSIIAFKRSEYKTIIKQGKNEGKILSDIGYIKESVDRMEKNLNLVDERYRDMLQRLSKLEEAVSRIRE